MSLISVRCFPLDSFFHDANSVCAIMILLRKRFDVILCKKQFAEKTDFAAFQNARQTEELALSMRRSKKTFQIRVHALQFCGRNSFGQAILHQYFYSRPSTHQRLICYGYIFIIV